MADTSPDAFRGEWCMGQNLFPWLPYAQATMRLSSSRADALKRLQQWKHTRFDVAGERYFVWSTSQGVVLSGPVRWYYAKLRLLVSVKVFGNESARIHVRAIPISVIMLLMVAIYGIGLGLLIPPSGIGGGELPLWRYLVTGQTPPLLSLAYGLFWMAASVGIGGVLHLLSLIGLRSKLRTLLNELQLRLD